MGIKASSRPYHHAEESDDEYKARLSEWEERVRAEYNERDWLRTLSEELKEDDSISEVERKRGRDYIDSAREISDQCYQLALSAADTGDTLDPLFVDAMIASGVPLRLVSWTIGSFFKSVSTNDKVDTEALYTQNCAIISLYDTLVDEIKNEFIDAMLEVEKGESLPLPARMIEASKYIRSKCVGYGRNYEGQRKLSLGRFDDKGKPVHDIVDFRNGLQELGVVLGTNVRSELHIINVDDEWHRMKDGFYSGIWVAFQMYYGWKIPNSQYKHFVSAVVEDVKIDPVRDYIYSHKGKHDRSFDLGKWFADLVGMAEDDPKRGLTERAFVAHILAVVRMSDPKMAHMYGNFPRVMLLIGRQGTIKSSFPRFLFGTEHSHNFYGELSSGKIRDRELQENTEGKGVIEISEMQTNGKIVLGDMKRLVSRSHQIGTKKYAIYGSDYPLRISWFGTANDEGSGVLPEDPEGGRRWVPVHVDTSIPYREFGALMDGQQSNIWGSAIELYESDPYFDLSADEMKEIAEWNKGEMSRSPIIDRVIENWVKYVDQHPETIGQWWTAIQIVEVSLTEDVAKSGVTLLERASVFVNQMQGFHRLNSALMSDLAPFGEDAVSKNNKRVPKEIRATYPVPERTRMYRLTEESLLYMVHLRTSQYTSDLEIGQMLNDAYSEPTVMERGKTLEE